ncbi:hypothetical protein H4217_006217 [Coemansia sp. RSA 1939]|nr:hypothetical protein H4217_006217 [Coemansia sp. RSA 1939]KAJ2601876.1 hypothetical protein EV177_006902 [Coemansia sp. RSA 1804]KAJ2692349.1 hypothetical protein GGH99_001788 [Coemansia sp. RSA 1285]
MDTIDRAAKQQSKQTAFRRAEKTYSPRGIGKSDLTGVIDPLAPDGSSGTNGDTVRRIQLTHDLETPTRLAFQAFRQKRPPAYVLVSHPDLIVIPDALTDEAQRWLARKCLCDCTRPPNRTNLDPFFDLPAEALFSVSARQERQQQHNHRDSDSVQSVDSLETVQCRVQLKSVDSSVTTPKDKFYLQPATASDLLERLRWCTLGMQYNWTTKEYDLGASAFDVEIDSIMRSIAIATTRPENGGCSSKGWPCANNYDGSSYESQAGIINYYEERSTMAAHVDKTEDNMDAPLVSLSVGLSCVYLIGGSTRDVEPTALLLRSGDILAMCGESRLAFHGVPRIIAGSSPEYLTDSLAGSSDVVAAVYPEWHHFARYLTAHRINCNARKCS